MGTLLLLILASASPAMVIRGADAQAGYDGWQASRYAGPAGFVSHMPGLRRNGGPAVCDAKHCRPAKGTMARAQEDTESCATPTAWIANDDRDGTDWFYAVCGTADGRICGQDVLWTDDACAEPTDEPDHRHDCPAGPYSDPR